MHISLEDNKLKNKLNLVIFIILTTTIIYAIIVRFINLDTLAFWGDDGMTYIGTVSTLKSGYPLLPSGNIMYHNIVSYYLKIIPIYLFGDNEFAYRFPSALFGVLSVPLIFLFLKELTNRYIATISAILIAINTWQIEFSREARYYSEFQFFYILTVYFFYKGFFQDKKVYKILAIIFFLITTQMVSIGMTLIFLFIPLLIYKGFRNFFKRDIIISFFISSAIILGEIVHRELFWKVGLSFYSPSIRTDIANPILRIFSKYFSNFTPFFYKIYHVIYPNIYNVFIFGSLLAVAYIFIKPLRNPDEHFLNIYTNNKIDLKFPFNLFFLYFIFFSNALFYGLGNMTTQQRYIYHVHPILIAVYVYILFEVSRIFVLIIKKTINKLRNINIKRIKLYNKYYTLATLLIFITVTFSIANYINPIQNFKITQRKNGDIVNNLFAPSNTFNFHHDPKTPGKYIGTHKKEGDIVIATDLLNPYPYTKQIDYWMWSASLFAWQPYDLKNGIYYDKFFGVPLVRDIFDFFRILNENSNKNIWVITSNSIRIPAHIDSRISKFLEENSQYKLKTGKDGICSAYLFPALDKGNRNYSLYSEIKLSPEEIIIIKLDENNKYNFSFTDSKNSNYLKYGWSDIENQGTWTDQKESLLFLKFEDSANYKITITMMPLYSPEFNQRVEIYLNQNNIEKFTFTSPGSKEYIIFIPEEFLNEEYNILNFKFRYALSPIALNINNNDSRNLAVYFNKIIFSKIEP